MSASRSKSPRLLLLGLLLAFPCATLLVAGPEEKEKKEKDAPGKKGKRQPKQDPVTEGEGETEGRALEAWGEVKEVKDSPFFSLAYVKSDGKKATKATVFVKPAEDATYFQDRLVAVSDLKEGDAVWIFGRPVEHEVADKTGTKGVDRQLQNVSGLASGSGIRVNSKYKDPRDPKAIWSRGEVAKAGPSILVTCDGAEYKVIMGKQTPILLREKTESKPIKNGMRVELSCDKSDERPETKGAADAKKESYVAKRIVLLDRRLVQSLYPMLLE